MWKTALVAVAILIWTAGSARAADNSQSPSGGAENKVHSPKVAREDGGKCHGCKSRAAPSAKDGVAFGPPDGGKCHGCKAVSSTPVNAERIRSADGGECNGCGKKGEGDSHRDTRVSENGSSCNGCKANKTRQKEHLAESAGGTATIDDESRKTVVQASLKR